MRSIGALAVVLLGTACASHRFDEHFEAGRFAEAAAAFDADPDLRSQERALYRAGVARALPRSPAYQPDSARIHLSVLLELHPRTEYRPAAESILALLDATEQLSAEVERLRAEAARVEGVLGGLEKEAQALRERERELRAELTTVRGQLESLKEIDLRRGQAPVVGQTAPVLDSAAAEDTP